MGKKILVTAQNPEETRVAIVHQKDLIDFDAELSEKKTLRGNVYLAKVVRIEPSLQAVFIEYGKEKNGFLAFSEIHPDYYHIPIEDLAKQEELKKNEEKEEAPEEEEAPASPQETPPASFAFPSSDSVFLYPETVSLEKPEIPPPLETEKKPFKDKPKKQEKYYRVQEVIQNKQVLLVQVLKDERGNKCASFTTYLSFPGQYCVLMPNAGERNGGISKRIHEDDTRKRLKDVVKGLDVSPKMSVIIRTAGQERTQKEIQRDYEYLLRVWKNIREKTLESNAPALIHEEANILMRTVRDFYQKDVAEIWTDTPEAYKDIRSFMKQLSPSGVKKVKLYKEANVSLFNLYDIEKQIVAMVSPRVELPSGGSLVIGQTEALVAIDVNSGRATKERTIDTTALKTNLEASKEIARQLRLRDLSGLIVIDFIDMSDHKHILQVERRFQEELEADRARIQTAPISPFGLLELSRQRLRPSIMETYSEQCPHCQGRGRVYSQKYFASTVLVTLEKIMADGANKVTVWTPVKICEKLLNENRKQLSDLEQKYQGKIIIRGGSHLADTDFVLDDGKGKPTLSSLDGNYDEDEKILEKDFAFEIASSEAKEPLQKPKVEKQAQPRNATNEERAANAQKKPNFQPLKAQKQAEQRGGSWAPSEKLTFSPVLDRKEKTESPQQEIAEAEAAEEKLPNAVETTKKRNRRSRRRSPYGNHQGDKGNLEKNEENLALQPLQKKEPREESRPHFQKNEGRREGASGTPPPSVGSTAPEAEKTTKTQGKPKKTWLDKILSR
ncbi:hypothetical protein AGMMS49949_07620 [Alphaproteobacteria bacterium]|nr:hypothetical protein AGMMS49949_07620 [Alphaproteobacteria bacterium]GHS98905.1 hypothetical protein AGMMS50296_6830 [Alphaproteobacteria bacterium]